MFSAKDYFKNKQNHGQNRRHDFSVVLTLQKEKGPNVSCIVGNMVEHWAEVELLIWINNIVSLLFPYFIIIPYS